MEKAVFLDRDGVIILERGEYNYLPEHIQIVEGIVEFCAGIIEKGYKIIVISNQSGISKGIYTQKQVKELHKVIQNFFASYKIPVTEFYYCPHHPDQTKCLCRKPGSLMLEKAIAVYKIDVEKSFFIGDMERDIEAGTKVGLKTIKIEPNENLFPKLQLIP